MVQVYITSMSERLLELVDGFIIRAGRNGVESLAMKAGVSASMIREVREGHVPLPQNIYRLALACGCSDEEALAMAKRPSKKAKETA